MEFIEEKGRFFKKDEDGNLIAEITYTNEDSDVFVINHTFVDSTYRGQGIAQELIKVVVDKARVENKKITPVCSYAVAQFEQHPEYQEVQK